MTWRPSWLLALAFIAGVVAVVFLEYTGRPVDNVMAMVAPVLAALFVAARVESRSNEQDQKLEEHSTTLARVEHATNGALTDRLDAALQPVHDRLDNLYAALLRNHPHDPLAEQITHPEEK